MNRQRKAHSSFDDRQTTFMEDLEQSLLNSHDLYGLDAFEAVFNKKKMINQMINKERKLKQEAQQAYRKARQRVSQIQQLQSKVEKQTSLLRSQVEKINDAHNIAKILMMQKIVKLQKQTEDIDKKRNHCYEVRCERERSVLATVSRNINKLERTKLANISRTAEVRQEIQLKNYQTIQLNRQKADSVRSDRERRHGRLQRIEEYKLERAKKNYLQKIQKMQKTIEQREMQLGKLTLRQQAEQNHLEIAETVSDQYLNSFFPTSTLD